MRLFPVVVIALAIAVSSYLGAFMGTRAVLAHYTHCDAQSPWTTNPCNDVPGGIPRYYAQQQGDYIFPGGTSNGIEGFISAQDVSMHDTANDFIANYLAVGYFGLLTEWVQTGFVEGILPNGAQRTTPRVYNETKSACATVGYSFAERSTPAGSPRYNEYFRVSWHGSYGYCGNTRLHVWQYGRGSSFGTFDYGFMFSSSGAFTAGTELRDKTHMEPSGTQCFGGGYLCTPSEYGYDLFLWDQSDGYWYLWDTSHPTYIAENWVVQGYPSGYFHNPSPGEPYYRFTTTSGWQ